MSNDKIFFKGLNGVRAVAAINVLLAHTLSLLRGMPKKDLYLPKDVGMFGVTVFFTLSGFLITYLLLSEKEKTATIGLRKFYTRRILRIWPLYFFYIALSLLSGKFIFHQHLHHPESLAYYIIFFAFIPFSINSSPQRLVHLWSIGVEELFYTFWAPAQKHIKNIKRFILYFIFIVIGIRLVCAWFFVYFHIGKPYIFARSLRFDCMAIGALFAYYYYHRNVFLIRISRSFLIPVLFWLFFLASIFYKYRFFSILSDDVVSIITALFIVYLIINDRKNIIMDNPVMNFIGQISYGIYVYQFLVFAIIISLFRKFQIHFPPPIFLLIDYCSIISVSALSYYFFERPFLRLKEKFTIISSGKI